MNIEIQDYNGAGRSDEWNDIEQTLKTMRLHLKKSDQKGKQGLPIFDPIGTNQFIKSSLGKLGWERIPIPAKYRFFGTDIDLGKGETVLEVQFSNYPFLFNNVVRLEFFFRSKAPVLGDRQVSFLVIVTKGHMFPASNSTLYYEQAKRQLDSLTELGVFKIPIRLIGVVGSTGSMKAVWTEYRSSRYSRDVIRRKERECVIHPSSTPQGRCAITL